MSYIRSGSNPEGLYVFGSTSGYVEFFQNGEMYRMMPRIFETLGYAYWKEYVCDMGPSDDGFEFEGGYLTWVTVPNGEPNHLARELGFPESVCVDWKVRIGMKGEEAWHIDMWPVTCSWMFDRFRDDLKYSEPLLKQLQLMIRLFKRRLLGK